jgi:hypothetical protein
LLPFLLYDNLLFPFLPLPLCLPICLIHLAELCLAFFSPPLQQAFQEVKSEVRQVLAAHRITQMAMKPVLREYAWEDASMKRGRQWVLKVRYPATQPVLPHGLEGSAFKTAFGAGQSCMEALVLKRKVMGPGWLSVRRPRRVDSSAQFSWCRLEVEVDGHKAVTAMPEGTRWSHFPWALGIINCLEQLIIRDFL